LRTPFYLHSTERSLLSRVHWYITLCATSRLGLPQPSKGGLLEVNPLLDNYPEGYALVQIPMNGLPPGQGDEIHLSPANAWVQEPVAQIYQEVG
jgi:hypothetical protein